MDKIYEFGVSFSLHRCSELGIDKNATLTAALEDLKFRRFRLMSYWNIHEKRQGQYNFDELDWQLDLIASYGGQVSLCLGKRQPRWPECHIPAWAAALPREEWYKALYKYIEVVVNRYQNHPALISWQLENEALLKEFGHCVDQDYNSSRLQSEFELVKSLDNRHPVIMTLSDSWGIPMRLPRPDIYAASLYRHTINKRGRYVTSRRPALFYKSRAAAIKALHNRSVFIHELQAEPWLPQPIISYDAKEQLEHMDAERIKSIIVFAQKTGLFPIDLWGLEWWHSLKVIHGRPECWQVIKDVLRVSG